MEKGYIAVVGGVNMDIGARSHAPLVERDSNPGKISLSPGGVGRNIAHDLAALGADVCLLTAFGGDGNAALLQSACREHGIDISRALVLPGESSSVYLFVAGPDGDMALAVSDMDICRRIDPDYLSSCRDVLDGAAAVVIDANLPEETLRFLADTCTAPLFADPVSTAKAPRLRPILGKLHTLKPNRQEAETLTGIPITDADSLDRAASALLETGLQRVFLTLGGDGVYAADRSGVRLALPAAPRRAVDFTGCGDAFTAALAWAFLRGGDLTFTARAGLTAAAFTAESPAANAPGLSEDALLARMASFA